MPTAVVGGAGCCNHEIATTPQARIEFVDVQVAGTVAEVSAC